jgi:hypothetical protein
VKPTQRSHELRETAVPQVGLEDVISDETTSEWLRTALQGALQRDPVDSLNDALLLAGLLEERLRLLFLDLYVEEECTDQD